MPAYPQLLCKLKKLDARSSEATATPPAVSHRNNARHHAARGLQPPQAMHTIQSSDQLVDVAACNQAIALCSYCQRQASGGDAPAVKLHASHCRYDAERCCTNCTNYCIEDLSATASVSPCHAAVHPVLNLTPPLAQAAAPCWRVCRCQEHGADHAGDGWLVGAAGAAACPWH